MLLQLLLARIHFKSIFGGLSKALSTSTKSVRAVNTLSWPTLLLSIFLSAACGGGGSSIVPPPISLNLTLNSSMALAPQDGTPSVINATVTGNSGAATLSVGTLPPGVSAVFVQPAAAGAGSVSFSSSPAATPGTYTVSITATAGPSTASKSVSLVVAISAVVAASTDATSGINGRLQQFMSTSFQPAGYDDAFFTMHPDTTPLNNLAPQHIRLQGVAEGVPMKANSNPQQAADWDFSTLDAVVQPVLTAADHSPEFQVAVAPSFMNDANGHLDIANHLNDFVQYSANLVRYYNKGGFDWGGQHFQSASANHITWWGVFNEYNINGLTAAQYVQLYNAMVPAMLAVDPTIKFSALELSDFDSGEGDPRANLPTFVAAKNAGGVNAQVDIASTHFYSSCNQTDPDAALLANVANFASDISYFRAELQSRADLAAVPVWVTENNVNADYDAGNGISACNPGQKFVTDQRGTSAFFAAWRPFVFSQLGKAGNQALYHWQYDSDQQYGEVDYTSGNIYLSYWVDSALGQNFPAPPGGPYPSILALTDSESTAPLSVEILATKNPDNSVVLMVANHAVHSPADNNGAGDPRTTILDISALGNFSTVTQLNIDASTDVTAGPQPLTIPFASKFTVTQPGYGVAFLVLKP